MFQFSNTKFTGIIPSNYCMNPMVLFKIWITKVSISTSKYIFFLSICHLSMHTWTVKKNYSRINLSRFSWWDKTHSQTDTGLYSVLSDGDALYLHSWVRILEWFFLVALSNSHWQVVWLQPSSESVNLIINALTLFNSLPFCPLYSSPTNCSSSTIDQLPQWSLAGQFCPILQGHRARDKTQQ